MKYFEAVDSNGTEVYLFQLEDNSVISVPKEQLEFKPLSPEELKEMEGQKKMKYVPYKDVAMLALSSMSLLNSEWQLTIQGLPTIDIVHCDECKFENTLKCPPHSKGLIHEASDYCSYGIRRDKGASNGEDISSTDE